MFEAIPGTIPAPLGVIYVISPEIPRNYDKKSKLASGCQVGSRVQWDKRHSQNDIPIGFGSISYGCHIHYFHPILRVL